MLGVTAFPYLRASLRNFAENMFVGSFNKYATRKPGFSIVVGYRYYFNPTKPLNGWYININAQLQAYYYKRTYFYYRNGVQESDFLPVSYRFYSGQLLIGYQVTMKGGWLFDYSNGLSYNHYYKVGYDAPSAAMLPEVGWFSSPGIVIGVKLGRVFK